MSEATTIPRGENWLLYGPLVLLSTAAVIAGALAAYWATHEWLGYHGGKSVVFYLGGAFGGHWLTLPLWSLYRRRYPKPEPS